MTDNNRTAAWYAVRYHPCPLCSAPPGMACTGTRNLADGHHPERVDAACAAAAELLEVTPTRRPYDQTDAEIAHVPDEYRDDDRPVVLLAASTTLGRLQRRAFGMRRRR